MEQRPTVFTSPFCGMCLVLKKWLAEWRVAYREVDISSDERAQPLLRKLANGYLSVPTVVFEDGTVLVEPSREALATALATPRPMPHPADKEDITHGSHHTHRRSDPAG